jgi:hypothetical protein
LPPLLPPATVEVPSLSLKLLDGEISTSNTTADGEITRVVKHAANTTGGVETIIDTATNGEIAIANPLPPDSVTLQKQHDISTNEKYPSDTNTLPVSTKNIRDYSSICKTKLTLHNPSFWYPVHALISKLENDALPNWTVLTQMILQLKPSALTTDPTMQTMKPSSTQAAQLNLSWKKHLTTSAPSKTLM